MCKKCIVVAAGELDGVEKSDFADYCESYVIAADGGYINACKLGLKVNLLVGDMDSYTGELPPNTEVVKHPSRKNSTDTHLAISLALQKGYTDIAVLCALGGRQDHAYANLQLLKLIKTFGGKGRIFYEGGSVTLIENESIVLTPQTYRGFSIYSFGEAAEGVCITGAAYPLCNAVIKNSESTGTSNYICGNSAQVSVGKGSLLVFSYKM